MFAGIVIGVIIFGTLIWTLCAIAKEGGDDDYTDK